MALNKNFSTKNFVREIRENVPRGTFLLLEAFVELLLKWNQKVNLISRQAEGSIWSDHVLDSLEALKYINADNPTIMDVGSGAGFPGMILSIATGWSTILVERKQKKCAFLREAKSVTDANVTIEDRSVEELSEYQPSIITSRGVATITDMLSMTSHLITNDCQMILWKGQEYQKEIEEALKGSWNFKFQCHKSKIRGMIVILSDFITDVT